MTSRPAFLQFWAACATSIPTLLLNLEHQRLPPLPPAIVTLASDTKSSLLVSRTISFPAEMDGPQRLSPNTQKQGRRRRSSSIIYQEPPESIEHTSDQAALPNLNANWVNAKGESFLSLKRPCQPVAPNKTCRRGLAFQFCGLLGTSTKPPD